MSQKNYQRIKKLTIMQSIGIGLFLLSFAVFISVIFLGAYKLDESVLKDAIGEDKLATVQNANSDQWQLMNGKRYSNQFAFISDLSDLFEETNEFAISQLGLSDEQLKELVERSESNGQWNYSEEVVNEVLGADSELASKLKSSTSWMFEKTYSESKALKNDLESKVPGVNNSILESKGFPQGAIKGLKKSVTRSATVGVLIDYRHIFLFICFVLTCLGGLLYIVPAIKLGPAGIKNDHIWFRSGLTMGSIGIGVGVFLISFYVLLYWYPEYITSWIVLVDPVRQFITGEPASEWFLYGLMYTMVILVMGVRMFIKYRNNKYQLFRTASVMFFQLGFAFLIPEILVRMNQPYYDFKNIWPLDYDFFFSWHLEELMANDTLGLFMLGWGIALIALGVPIFTYFFGKRWYCSWVCGCGGLAETLGDPYRQRSDKRLKAWKFERYSVHGVLVFAVVMTGLTLYTYFTDDYELLGVQTASIQSTYGFLIGAAFAGVVGTGFYPFMGNRVWCRFGCPLAAYLGLVQRFKSRFRITTNGGQCISCGNCSTYCEMGIDVRWYAQRGQNIVRASCVGCGICSAVCPRGVLKLENGPEENRFNDNPIVIGSKGSQLAPQLLSPSAN
jgi:Pyruvate/2-oxoacid:ferredoxin oxidoreductase delta subunit